jgi:hypothetical protein
VTGLRHRDRRRVHSSFNQDNALSRTGDDSGVRPESTTGDDLGMDDRGNRQTRR